MHVVNSGILFLCLFFHLPMTWTLSKEECQDIFHSKLDLHPLSLFLLMSFVQGLATSRIFFFCYLFFFALNLILKFHPITSVCINVSCNVSNGNCNCVMICGTSIFLEWTIDTYDGNNSLSLVWCVIVVIAIICCVLRCWLSCMITDPLIRLTCLVLHVNPWLCCARCEVLCEGWSCTLVLDTSDNWNGLWQDHYWIRICFIRCISTTLLSCKLYILLTFFLMKSKFKL